MTPAPPGLVRRYCPDDLAVFTIEERERFLGPLDGAPWESVGPAVGWELLYRLERVLRPPGGGGTASPGDPRVASGAGGVRRRGRGGNRAAHAGPRAPLRPPARGRARRADAIDARSELRHRGLDGWVEVVNGFFERLPVADGEADLVIACSAFTTCPGHGSSSGLDEMVRACRHGGLVVVVWADDPAWLVDQGIPAHGVPRGDGGRIPRCRGSPRPRADLLARSGGLDPASHFTAGVPCEILGTNPPREHLLATTVRIAVLAPLVSPIAEPPHRRGPGAALRPGGRAGRARARGAGVRGEGLPHRRRGRGGHRRRRRIVAGHAVPRRWRPREFVLYGRDRGVRRRGGDDRRRRP